MIETVRGEIPAEALGVTCMHDHVLSDSSRLHRPGAQPAPADDRVSPETTGYLRWNALALADNLRLDDPDVAVAELSALRATRQRSLVECSSWGLGPVHEGLPAVAEAAGVTIVVAYGAYIPRTVPAHIAELDEATLEEHFVAALTVAVPGTAYRAGMLGIMGTTDALAPREREQLRAAGRAAVRTGAAVSVRLDDEVYRGLEVLEILGAEGLPAGRVVFTNADEYMDAGYWADLAAAGAVLEMCFGSEMVHEGRMDNPSDRERLAFFPAFVAANPEARHVLGQSTWTKMQLRRHGGYGYDYLARRIVPALGVAGVPAERIERMLVAEPARLLDRRS
ncbi:hypothetical protein [Microbacterium sp. SORGH_AS_0888]|uniref:phosphotriesterase family protein n=1 Tax=Microbacterium sp. SORGH_AS_0888 TaxID=3041791 RepID=UPI0027836429|nr:hypothetical protein [Microbacterium sp. SORGH_AS_0888]MDQ1129283.1 phosphotriesterase-related protein [Microbacterium sp. SORGH_AS_0888]